MIKLTYTEGMLVNGGDCYCYGKKINDYILYGARYEIIDLLVKPAVLESLGKPCSDICSVYGYEFSNQIEKKIDALLSSSFTAQSSCSMSKNPASRVYSFEGAVDMVLKDNTQ